MLRRRSTAVIVVVSACVGAVCFVRAWGSRDCAALVARAEAARAGGQLHEAIIALDRADGACDFLAEADGDEPEESATMGTWILEVRRNEGLASAVAHHRSVIPP